MRIPAMPDTSDELRQQVFSRYGAEDDITKYSGEWNR